jgi:peptidoglycan/LPS O-acetylase OafA/YrhL
MTRTETPAGIAYRPEIDGIRAIAVLAVLLFHLGLSCAGGYVGVDVFFVISGFLITRLLRQQQAAGTLTLSGFWSRRIRRLWPAMAVMLVAACGASWKWLLPVDFKEFGASLVAQATLSSNVYFWTKAGYFDAAAEVTPLLHTWTLAIEEQFYLLFPLLFVAGPVMTPARLRAVVIALVAGSFALSAYGTYSHPSAAFFLLPSRAWELGLGALVCLVGTPGRLSSSARAVAAWVGLGAIAYAVFIYTARTPFPGAAALLPCAGTALLIAGTESRRHMLTRLLSSKPLVFVGLISYSLYLWHWPLIVFWTYLKTDPALSGTDKLSLLALSFAAAVASYYLVETPVRSRRVLRATSGLVASALAVLVACVTFGGVVHAREGVPARLPRPCVQLAAPDVDPVLTVQTTLEDLRRDRVPLLAAGAGSSRSRVVDVLLWGDSHANSIAIPIRDAATRYGLSFAMIAHPETAPLLGFWRPAQYGLARGDAAEFSARTLDFIRAHAVRRVILAGRWGRYVLDARSAVKPAVDPGALGEFKDALSNTVAAIRSAGADVWLVLDEPDPQLDVPRALSRTCLQGHDASALSLPSPATRPERVEVKRVLESMHEKGARTLDTFPVFVDANDRLVLADGAKPLFYDRNHLSTTGARRLDSVFQSALAPE